MRHFCANRFVAQGVYVLTYRSSRGYVVRHTYRRNNNISTVPTERIEEKLNRKPELQHRAVDGGVHEAARVLRALVAGLALEEHVSERHVVVVVLLQRG